ncbi:hypothetical protein [Mycobacterium talmoniae]|uniref:Transmembrane protein n=1 Tax=Mycobacterium talmoniae TaxID=1858794 RepID=A0A1S1NP24_9MYCO|nr:MULTISPECIES: hypothetical protein [Mycobacterium]OHV05969.1 hypothetical protein BKN37_03860 [Mycobacterium talmoniae]TDH56765.1 hypothetical protein E2F47_05095 [Mycobacterium eburneum]
MRNLWRVVAFDIAAPLAAVAALLAIGVVLGWPWWWVSACSVLVLLVLEGVAINFWLLRRDAVTVGTDDDGPGLRLAVVALCTAALVAAVVVGFERWTEPDREFTRDSAQVVQIATTMAEATATFTPQNPTGAAEKAAALMVPERAEAFKQNVAKSSADLAHRNVTAQALTLSAGVEALGPSMGTVTTVLRVIQNAPGQPPDQAVVALRVALTKRDGQWLVLDVSPINQR